MTKKLQHLCRSKKGKVTKSGRTARQQPRCALCNNPGKHVYCEAILKVKKMPIKKRIKTWLKLQYKNGDLYNPEVGMTMNEWEDVLYRAVTTADTVPWQARTPTRNVAHMLLCN